MPNFFTDNKDLQYHFSRLDLEEAVSILEHHYTFAEKYEGAPRNYKEAMELYQSALDLAGDISGNHIAPRAMEVDQEGAHLENGKVTYAKGTQENLRQLSEAGLMGVILPYKDGGINFPATIFMMMIEMVSRADASLMTLFGYQDVGEAISKFGSDELSDIFLKKYCKGEYTGAMVLTEPGAGSDLQSVKLKAYQDEEGQWRLQGVKHFISNGCGDVLLVLARSEPNTTNMFGLSLFVVKGGDKVQVNHIEEKMGIHGSPTCQLYFDDAPAYLVGKRRHGLIYVLYTLNHARFSVAAQALGIAEAAYQEALQYAKVREQFGKLIYNIPAVSNLLIDMRVAIESGRSLLYAGSQWLDLRNKLEEQIEELKKEGKPFSDIKEKFDHAAKLVDLLSPMVKYIITENAVKICYDAQQIHGGMGFMREMPVERLARDVRITTIYEGTSQVQVGGSSKGVLGDVLGSFFDEMAKQEYPSCLSSSAKKLGEIRSLFNKSKELVNESDDQLFRETALKELVDMYGAIYTGYLLLDEAKDNERKVLIANRFINKSIAAAHQSMAAIENNQFGDMEHKEVICE
ncbi:acyl-CoA dehydrogenase family protein [Fulvivirgaceae bacterium BMA10]|uniref:Acyl-CoA dehydrogenase family protein n=1 Tax=Splendidivirga corallicola TaxID=3051826 RepID=A0ABT8KMC9_9BACT|nr:acyl-CoA dehydrogenase family protein [Fulvivirgaceae bacterium BMA10]